MYSSVPAKYYRKTTYADLILVVLFLVFLHYFVGLAREWNGRFFPEAPIDLSFLSLPKYSFFSLIRAFVAYLFSLAFTLVYGYVAAKSKASERVMIPLLDIGQSIPVLGFMPGLVLGLIALFPRSNFGMELACILLIFTGQVWNMTFAFYSSIRAVPKPFYEMADVVGLNWWNKLLKIELPFSATALAWNSLMSMAGGWFFLIACESFTLGEKNFRLPGLGSYMSVAIEKNDIHAIIAGVVAMCLVILFTDFLIWRPTIAWTRKFRLEEMQEDTQDVPFLTLLVRESQIVRAVLKLGQPLGAMMKWVGKPGESHSSPDITESDMIKSLVERTPLSGLVRNRIRHSHWVFPWLRKFGWRLGLAFVSVIAVWALIRIWELVRDLHFSDWKAIWFGAFLTLLRVSCALVLGSLWAVPFGIWVGLSPKLTRIFQPIIQLGASFPAPMIYPLALAVFEKLGLGLPVSSTFLMLLGVQWYILFNVLAGAVGISRDLTESFSLAGVDRLYQWKELYLPSIFPSLLTGWITAAGGAWNASIVSEYVQYGGKTLVAPGLGSLISQATAAGNYPMLAGCIIVMVAVVVGVNRLFWRPIQRLAESRFKFER